MRKKDIMNKLVYIYDMNEINNKVDKNNYRPLPSSLTIKKSNTEGLGLFSTEFIENGRSLGITHIYHNGFEDGLIRTPLGGFFNHSEIPNVEVRKMEYGLIMVAIKDINQDEEILAIYTLYNPTE